MISEELREKLQDPEYRKAFVASQINIGIPFQIRALLKSRPGWTQKTLADRTGMLQPRISGLMTPGRTRPNIETLRRVAEAFDCGLMVRFVPFSELAHRSDAFDPESFSVPSFAQDTGFIDHKPMGSATPSSTWSGWTSGTVPLDGYQVSETTQQMKVIPIDSRRRLSQSPITNQPVTTVKER